MSRRGCHLQVVNHFIGKVAGFGAIHKNGLALAVTAQHHIVHNVHIADKPHPKAILRHKGKSDSEFPDLKRGLVLEVDDLVLFEQHLALVDKFPDLLIGFAGKVHRFAVFVAEFPFCRQLLNPV